MKNKKLLLSTASILTMLFVSVPTAGAQGFTTQSTSTSISAGSQDFDEYDDQGEMVYDCATGKSWYVPPAAPSRVEYGQDSAVSAAGYFPYGIVDEPNMQTVFGKDDRTKVTTNGQYSSIVYLAVYSEDGKKIGHGTGFMIGHRAIATAAHVIYKPKYQDYRTDGKRWCGYVEAYLPDNGEIWMLSARSTTMHVSTNWFNRPFSDEGNVKNDWAVIELDTKLNAGWLGLKSNRPDNNAVVQSAGFPKSKNGNMYHVQGTLEYNSKWNYFRTQMDNGPGQSGSPVYYYDNETGYTACGIFQGETTTYNTVTPLTQGIINNFLQYRDQAVYYAIDHVG